jgi:hypothetical protein
MQPGLGLWLLTLGEPQRAAADRVDRSAGEQGAGPTAWHGWFWARAHRLTSPSRHLAGGLGRLRWRGACERLCFRHSEEPIL